MAVVVAAVVLGNTCIPCWTCTHPLNNLKDNNLAVNVVSVSYPAEPLLWLGTDLEFQTFSHLVESQTAYMATVCYPRVTQSLSAGRSTGNRGCVGGLFIVQAQPSSRINALGDGVRSAVGRLLDASAIVVA